MTLQTLPIRIGLLGLLLLAGPLTAQDSLPAELQPVATRLRALAAAEWAYNDRWDLFTDDLTSLTLDPSAGPAATDSVALLVTFANASGWIAFGWTVSNPYRQCVMFGGYGDPPFLPDPPATSAGTLALEPGVPACDD